tara:strand:+ start:454 stop:597 length:144 start_codon:yes stop_codon:yes gene_type:complete
MTVDTSVETVTIPSTVETVSPTTTPSDATGAQMLATVAVTVSLLTMI